jgi:two-component system cell cycle response regulator DivK
MSHREFYAVTEMQQQAETTQRTILLVEDDDDTRRTYSVMLRQAGFLVVEAADGSDAVRCALEDSPDLILMDMNLPALDGWEAARRIRSDAQAGSTPLLAFSALIDSTADLRRESALFDGFIAKPVTPGELVRRVAAYVELLAPAVRKPGGSSRPSPAQRELSARERRAGKAWQ